MKSRAFLRYWLSALAAALFMGAYPLYMGVRVLCDMIRNGTVMAADYPKYVIPYTPISVAVIFALILMPVLFKYAGRFALPAAQTVGLAVFFASELMLERLVTVTDTEVSSLEGWQMYMCYVPPELTRTRAWTPVDVLIGEYSPSFKIHFYVIAIILILALIGCFYGFGSAINDGRRDRIRSLVLLSAVTLLFLGLCILACFTAFFRSGELYVSPVSALLMAVFFITMGLTAGLFAAVILPLDGTVQRFVCAGVSAAVTVIMYIGEMCLLHGNLYRLGSGFLFEGLGALALAPIDVIIIILSGVLAYLCAVLLRR